MRKTTLAFGIGFLLAASFAYATGPMGISLPPLLIQDEGVPLPIAFILNMTGDAVTCTNDGGVNTCTFTGSVSDGGLGLCGPGTTLTSIYVNSSVIQGSIYSKEPIADTPFNIDAVRYTIGETGISDGGTENLIFLATDTVNVCECEIPCAATADEGDRATCAGACAFPPTQKMRYSFSSLGSCSISPQFVGNLTVEGHCLADAGVPFIPDAGAPDAGAPDAGGPDAGEPDAGTDAGTDAGAPDAGEPDAGAPDAGDSDAGADAGVPDSGILAFKFAPASGAGMGTACSGAPLTSEDGVPLTFARTGTAYCTAGGFGLRTTGIANGDLVAVGTDTPRTEYDSDGVLGLLVEPQAANLITYNTQFNNAAWVKSGGATVVADFGTAPDNTATADKLSVSSCAGTSSLVAQSHSVSKVTDSIYVRSVSGPASVSVCASPGQSGTNGACVPCSVTDSSWTRCQGPTAQYPYQYGYFFVGCVDAAVFSGHSNTGAADVLVWGAQAEYVPSIYGTGLMYPTSVILTTSSAAGRQAEDAHFDSPGINLGTASGEFSVSAYASANNVSFARTDVHLGTVVEAASTDGTYVRAGNGLLSLSLEYFSCSSQYHGDNPTEAIKYGGAGPYLTAEVVSCAGKVQTVDGSPVAAVFGNYNNSNLTPGVGSSPQNSPIANIQLMNGGPDYDSMNGIISRFCIAPDPTSCYVPVVSVPDAGVPPPPEDGGVFLFATTTGRGMGTNCSGEPLTTPDGGQLTFYRASSATCTKGVTGEFFQGIQYGDVVTVSNDQPRTEYDPDGVLGLLVEGGATNYVPRSDDFSYWTLTPYAYNYASNVAAAPDGTLTADKFSFSSCYGLPGGAAYGAYITVDGDTRSVYVRRLQDLRGASQLSPQSVSICASDNGGVSGECSKCDITEQSWTRCYLKPSFPRSASNTFFIGCNTKSSFDGGSNTGGGPIYVWGAQSETSTYFEEYTSASIDAGMSYPTSYIPTSGSPASREDDKASFNLGVQLVSASGAFSNVNYASNSTQKTLTSVRAGVFDYNTGTGLPQQYQFYYAPNTRYYCNEFNAAGSGGAARYVGTGLVASPGYPDYINWVAPMKWYCYSDSATLYGEWGNAAFGNYVTMATRPDGYDASAANHIVVMADELGTPPTPPGTGVFADYSNGIISRMCIDPDPTRCQ